MLYNIIVEKNISPTVKRKKMCVWKLVFLFLLNYLRLSLFFSEDKDKFWLNCSKDKILKKISNFNILSSSYFIYSKRCVTLLGCQQYTLLPLDTLYVQNPATDAVLVSVKKRISFSPPRASRPMKTDIWSRKGN